MDFEATPEEAAFRPAARAFLDVNAERRKHGEVGAIAAARLPPAKWKGQRTSNAANTKLTSSASAGRWNGAAAATCRLADGTNEILPRDPQADKGLPFRDIPTGARK